MPTDSTPRSRTRSPRPTRSCSAAGRTRSSRASGRCRPTRRIRSPGPLNRLPKYVASRTLDRVDWSGAELIGGDVVERVRALKAQPGRELQVHGSAGLVQTLIAHDLIDLYRILIFPLTLGSGRRLFAEGTKPAALKLVSSRSTANGVTSNVYEPAGEPRYGNMAE